MSEPGVGSQAATSADRGGRPRVPMPSGGPSPAVLIGACLVLGLALFAFLDGRRHQQSQPSAFPSQPVSGQLPPAAPALEIPPPPPPAPPVPTQASAPSPAKPQVQIIYRPGPPPPPVIQYVDRPALGPPPMGPGASRLQEPALVIDLTQPAGTGQTDEAHATVMRHKSMIIPQGTIIPAVLETPINSSVPGMARAITSRDTSGFDGSRVLIPKGSRLFGDYQSNVQAGQSRVLVTWSTLVRPDGVSIKLASPASDANGGFGIPGKVNNHILARFTSALLQSALQVGVNYYSYRAGAAAVIVGAPIQTATTAGGGLIPTAQAGPTITVKEGADIAVLVARDLDFSGALPRP